MINFYWQADRTPHELAVALHALSEEYSISEGSGAIPPNSISIVFERDEDTGGVEIISGDNATSIRYDRMGNALRGVGALLSGQEQAGERTKETIPFDTIGVMIDCSRNAVMTVPHLRKWLRRLALIGYNMAMLYTEDTYSLPGEEYFGYLRGSYSFDELRELDEYADALGIELIGCIQTLGHLEQMLKWSTYGDIKDTHSVLLVDHEKTHAVIEKMISQFASCYRSRRIHVGMDESPDLGRGRFLNLHGYRQASEIFNRHLSFVSECCKRHGLRPMIWSDMLFRMAGPAQSYYDRNTSIPEEVRQSVPNDVQLVYWDYYHEDAGFYRDWIGRHRDMGFEPLIGSGIWTWGAHLWYGHGNTVRTLKPCIDAVKSEGVREIFFTLWGDDGAYCEFDSALAGLTLAAQYACNGADAAASRVADRFNSVCGSDYDAVIRAAGLQDAFNAGMLLWDDPILRIYWKNERLKCGGKWESALKKCDGVLRELKQVKDQCEPVDFNHFCTSTRYLRDKIRVSLALDEAYGMRDPSGLDTVRRRARRMAGSVDKLQETFRRQWHRRNKPQGYETIQIRLGGQRQRWLELDTRLGELLSGVIDRIPELEEEAAEPSALVSRWRAVAGGGILA